MTYQTYVFILCAIVYVIMSIVTIAVVTALTKMSLKLVRCGAADEQIYKEYAKAQKKGRKKGGKTTDWIFSTLFGAFFVVVFAFSTYLNFTKFSCCETIPTFKVVNSGSMSEKLESNKYLFENDLNDQFDTLDLILTYKLPAENELALYDIVVYEYDGELIAHRIVGIEEPNEAHPNERYFRMQGDAVANPDKFPVRYSQMRGIYRGERIPFIGSFVVFMQSPAGGLCMILVLATSIAAPLIDKRLEKERKARLALILKRKKTENTQAFTNTATATALPPICFYPVICLPAPPCKKQVNGQGEMKK